LAATASPKTFAEAMKREGTSPLPVGVRRVAPARPSSVRPSGASAPTFHVERDDDWLEGRRTALSASGRRRLAGTPTATLDLHGDDTGTARRRLARFVASESRRGNELVLVIVGRGRHSPGGHAVLRDGIAEWLTTAPTSPHVLAFRTAPRELGGAGAVVVLLVR
jgi:DNA-nicking Smr family endonuclease